MIGPRRARNGPGFEPLEPRVMLSADPLSAAVADLLSQSDDHEPLDDATALQALLDDLAGLEQTSAPPPLVLDALRIEQGVGEPVDGMPPPDLDGYVFGAAERRHEVVFVDAATPDFQTLIDGLAADPDRDLAVYLLDADRDGVEQIAEILGGARDIDAVHIVSHGAAGGLQLGSTWLDADALERQSALIGGWAAALDEDADLLLYGCDFAGDAGGRALATALAGLTGADVAASVDATGATALGGDWDLEYRSGSVESALAFGDAAQASWDGILAAPVPAGGETLVNATTSGAQGLPDVGVYPNGDYVVAWQHTDAANGDEIMFRRFSADGTPKDVADMPAHAPLVTAEVSPAVAVSSGGNFVISWQGPGNEEDIYAAVFDVNGDPVRSAFVVNTTAGYASGTQDQPDVAMDAAGNFVVVWKGVGTGDANGVHGRLFNADGTPKAGGEFLVNQTTGGLQLDPAVAMNDSGAFVVAFVDASGTDHIDAVLFDSAGTVVNSVVAGPSAKVQLAPDVAMNDAGGFAVAWGERLTGSNHDIYHRLFDATGTAIDTDGTADAVANNVKVNTHDVFVQRDVSLAMNGAGDYVVTWATEDFPGDSFVGVSGREYAADGSARDATEFHVNTTSSDDQQNPAVGISINGSLVVVWDGNGTRSGNTDDEGIFAQRYGTPPVNTAPTVALANTTTSLAENTSTATRVKVADITVTDDGLGTNTLALTGADAALFEVDGTELFLKAGATLDFESNPGLDVNVTVDDATVGGSPDDTAALAISVTDVSEAPTPVGGEVLVNTTTAGIQEQPHLAIYDNGDYVVVWQAPGDDADEQDIMFRRFNADGTPKDATERFVHTQSEDKDTRATVAVSDNGNFVVTWESDGGNAGDVLAAVFDSNGDVVRSPFTVTASAGFADDLQRRPDVAMDAAGNFAIVWDGIGAGDGDDRGIFAQRYNADGTEKPGGPFIVNTGTADRQGDPVISMNDAGAFVIAFRDQDGVDHIDAVLYDAGGNVVKNFVAGTSGIDLERPDVAMNDAGGFVVAWNEKISTSEKNVYHRVFDAAGNAIDTDGTNDLVANNVKVNVHDSMKQDHASIGMRANGDYVIVWQSEDQAGDAGRSVAGREYLSDGTPRDGAEFSVNTSTAADQKEPEVAFAPTGEFVVVWSHNGDQAGNVDDRGIFAQRFTSFAGTNTAPTVSLSNPVTSLAEDASTVARVKVADISISDDGNGTNTLALTGADAALFEIDGTELYLKAGTALDFESNASLDVNVTVDDVTVGGTPDDTAALAITLTDVNEAPTVSLANATTTLPENATTTPRLKVADIDIADDALGSETITLSGTDALLFEVDGTELYLKAGTTLDFESNPVLNVTVAVDDNTVGGNPDDTAALAITITDVNEAPTVSLANTTTTLAENAATTPRVKVADISIGDDALGSETITLSGTDAALFEVDGTELYLKAGTTLDFESNPVLNVTVAVDDNTVGGNPDDTAALAITITDVNEAPTVSLANTVTTLAEDASTTPRLKVADIDIADDALGSETITLSGTDALLFEVDGTELYLKSGTTLDFESNPVLNVTVAVDDNTVGGNPDDTAALAITITDVNEAPTVSLANTVTTLAEDASTTPRLKVADIDIADDALGSETITLSGTDALLFEVDGTELYLKAGTALDFESNPVLNVTVAVDDNTVGGNPDDTAALAITITDVNEAPTVSLANTTTTLAENATTTPRVKVADVTIGDDALGSETLTLSGTDALLFEIDGTELYLKAGTTLDFESNPVLNVTVAVDDNTVGGNPDDTAALAITITDVNEAPAVSLANTTTTLAENATTTPRVKVADITIGDDALGSETLTLSGTDALLFEIDGTELYLKSGTTLDFESNPVLNVTVAVDDNTVGGNPDDTAALAITITDVNEAPTVSLANTVTTLAETATTTPRVKVADITIGDDALGSETLTLSGTDALLFEIDGTELFLKAGTALDFESNPVLNVTVAVDDNTVGGNPDDTAALAITITDVNEAPTVSLANTTTTLAENATTTPRVKVADITIGDDALGSETLTLSGTDALLFEVDGTELYLKAGTTLDFESNPVLNVTVAVDDNTVGGNPDDTAALAITITDVNEAPTVSLANTVTALAETTVTSPRVKVADIVITDDALGAETLVLIGTDAALFEIDGTELYLKDSTPLDAALNAVLDVTVTVNDPTVGGAPDDTVSLAIAITDVNAAPTVSLANTVTNLAENVSTSPRVKVADINIGDDATGTNNLALTGADAALFEIDGTELYLRDGTALDFESQTSLDVIVTVDDPSLGAGPEDSAVLSIAIGDVNEAPTMSLANTVTTLAESTSTATRVKVADINIADDALGSETITLSGTDALLFEIDGTELFLKAGTTLDFESNPVLNVTVAVDDNTVGGNPDDTAALAITITDVNEAPTVSLANTTTTLAENASTATRVKVADINIADDALGSETITLSGTDALLFEVDGTELFLKAGTTLDFESNPVLNVTVAVDDNTVGGNPDDSAALAITITDVNEAPTMSLANTVTTLAESTSTATRVKVADINIADDALGTETITLSGTDALLFEVDGTELFLKAGTALDFESNPVLNVTVAVDDNTVGGNPDDTAALAITITDVNEAPTMSLANTVTTLAESTSTATRVKVADINIADDALGTETITLSGTDALLFEVDGTELFLKALTTLDFESNPVLNVTVAVDDNTVGGNPDDTAALAITVTDVNEAPTVSLANTVTTLAESTSTATRVKVADINIADDALGTETITLSGTDALLFEVDGTELFLKAGTALDFESNPVLNVTVAVDDNTVGGNPDDTAALAITVTDVNEAPKLSLANTVTALDDTAATTPRIKVADITISDDALGSETLSLAGTDAALFEVDGLALYLQAGTVLDASANPSLDVTVRVDDNTVGGNPDDVANLSITVNEPAVVATTTLPEESVEEETTTPDTDEESPAVTIGAGAAAAATSVEPVVAEDEAPLEALAETDPAELALAEQVLEVEAVEGLEPPSASAFDERGRTTATGISAFERLQANDFVRATLFQVLENIAPAPVVAGTALGGNDPDADLQDTLLAALPKLVDGLDRLRSDVAEDVLTEQVVIASGVAASTGLSVGYVVWLIRGGVLLSSVLSSMPAWRFIDPLPVLSSGWSGDEGDDEESLESMVEHMNGTANMEDARDARAIEQTHTPS